MHERQDTQTAPDLATLLADLLAQAKLDLEPDSLVTPKSLANSAAPEIATFYMTHVLAAAHAITRDDVAALNAACDELSKIGEALDAMTAEHLVELVGRIHDEWVYALNRYVLGIPVHQSNDEMHVPFAWPAGRDD